VTVSISSVRKEITLAFCVVVYNISFLQTWSETERNTTALCKLKGVRGKLHAQPMLSFPHIRYASIQINIHGWRKIYRPRVWFGFSGTKGPPYCTLCFHRTSSIPFPIYPSICLPSCKFILVANNNWVWKYIHTNTSFCLLIHVSPRHSSWEFGMSLHSFLRFSSQRRIPLLSLPWFCFPSILCIIALKVSHAYFEHLS
jgi:hypothetical protein